MTIQAKDIAPCFSLVGNNAQSITLSYNELSTLIFACESYGENNYKPATELAEKLAKFMG